MGFRKAFLAGPGMGRQCSLQARTWSAWREGLAAAGAALVGLGLGCWMQWSCSCSLRNESSTLFYQNHSTHPFRKSWQTLPMPCHFVRSCLSVLTHCLLDSGFFRKERNTAPFLPSLHNSEDLTKKGRTAKSHLVCSHPEGSVISDKHIVGFFTCREPPFPTVLLHLRCRRH